MSRQLDYWTKRERAHEAQLKADQAKTMAIIKKQLLSSRDETKKLISAFWGNYAGAKGLTLEDAYKLASEMDVREFASKATEYVKNRDFSDAANSSLKTYNLKMRVNRLELLLREIDLELAKLNDKQIATTYDHLSKSAVDEFNRQAGILGSSVKWSQAKVDGIVTANHDSSTFMARWYNSGHNLTDELDMVIRSEIVGGRHPLQFAPKIARLFDTKTWEAQRLLVTETAYVQTAVQQSSFQSSGFTKGMLIAESNACDICLPLNGEVFELKKLKPGENSPPLHPNCRCSIVPIMDDKAWEDSLIARGIKSRDQLKWEKQDLANRAKVAEGRKQAIKGNDPDKDEYLKYSNLVTDNRTASIAKFKNIKYNDPVEWQRLQDNFYVKQQLQAGAWQDKINDDSQDKHLSRDRKKNKNSNPGKKPKSIFNDNFDPYEIYDRIKGTGSILRLDNGQPTNKERVNLARDIGTLGADNNHAYGVTIHYGKTGAHLVPWKGRK